MSIDRIAEIKRKIMTRKRVTIKGDDDYNPEVPQVAVCTFFSETMSSKMHSRNLYLR